MINNFHKNIAYTNPVITKSPKGLNGAYQLKSIEIVDFSVYFVAPISIFNLGTFPILFIISTSELIAVFILSTKLNFDETVSVNAVILSSLGTNKSFNKSPNNSINL